MWHGSQWPCLLGYLKMTPSSPITPSGHEETQCGPSCRLAQATHWSAPWKREGVRVQTKRSRWTCTKNWFKVSGEMSTRWQQHTQSYQQDSWACRTCLFCSSYSLIVWHQLELREAYRACAGLLPLLDFTLRVTGHTLPWWCSKLTLLPAFKARVTSLSKPLNRL